MGKNDPEIADVRWWTHGAVAIGAVAIRWGEAPQICWKAYLGVGRGYSERADSLHIAHTGAKLLAAEAAGLFPNVEGTYTP